MKNQLLFFTTCNNKYKQFIIPYIYMAYKYNPSAIFEFIIDDISQQQLNNIKKVQEILNIKSIIIRKLQFQTKYSFATLRFLLKPISEAIYTYIGDIDILITENILPFHINELNKYQTIFSNRIRFNNKNCMSGLHFVKSQEYFKQTENIRNFYLNNYQNMLDEYLLKLICIKSNLKLLPMPISNDEFNNKLRPAHGIHISLNRKPFTNRMEFPINEFKNKFLNVIFNTDEFKQILKYCDTLFINNLNICINYCKNK